MIEFLKNRKKDFIEWIEGLSNKQRLIYSIIFVVILIFLVKFLFGKILSRNESIIRYSKDFYGDDYKIFTEDIFDNNVYIQVKNVAEKFIELCSESRKEVTPNIMYNDIIYSEYKKYMSKYNLKKQIDNLLIKVKKIKDNNNYKLIPTDISQYRENFYLVEYSYIIDNEEITIWLGVALNSRDNLYNIWYIE